MQFRIPSNAVELGSHLRRFIEVVGKDVWFKRADHLASEMDLSPFRWKVVADYHWLEMAISFQFEVLMKHGCLLPEFLDPPVVAALQFAATVVEINNRFSPQAQRALVGRIRDGLKAETGFAALYLEIDLAKRLMLEGYDVKFVDFEGQGKFDIEFSRDQFVGEVECKSVSTDAGRHIHRKDFFRLIETISTSLKSTIRSRRHDVVVITLKKRLSSTIEEHNRIRFAIIDLLKENAPARGEHSTFKIERKTFQECFPDIDPTDIPAFEAACKAIFGENSHAAGVTADEGGCFIVMLSERPEDTSKPVLDAMRKASSQFSSQHPSFIAIQFQEIEAQDFLVLHLRRRMAILSYALFGHYEATHVTATYFTGFAGLVLQDGVLHTPAFAVPNPRPGSPIRRSDAGLFLRHISDADFAASLGMPRPLVDLTNIQL